MKTSEKSKEYVLYPQAPKVANRGVFPSIDAFIEELHNDPDKVGHKLMTYRDFDYQLDKSVQGVFDLVVPSVNDDDFFNEWVENGRRHSFGWLKEKVYIAKAGIIKMEEVLSKYKKAWDLPSPIPTYVNENTIPEKENLELVISRCNRYQNPEHDFTLYLHFLGWMTQYSSDWAIYYMIQKAGKLYHKEQVLKAKQQVETIKQGLILLETKLNQVNK